MNASGYIITFDEDQRILFTFRNYESKSLIALGTRVDVKRESNALAGWLVLDISCEQATMHMYRRYQSYQRWE